MFTQVVIRLSVLLVTNLNCLVIPVVLATLEQEGNRNYNSTYVLLLTSHTAGYLICVRASEAGACKIIYIFSDK